MHKGSIPITFIIYFILFLILFNPIKEGKIPIFDFSLFIMILIFWATYYVLKKNLFEPLIDVMKRREKFTREREENYEEALSMLKNFTEEYDKEIHNLREEEREKFKEFINSLKEKQRKEIDNFKREMEKNLKEKIKNLEEEKEKAKNLIRQKILELSKKLAERILRKDVA